MATFNEMLAPSSGTYVAEHGILMQIYQREFSLFGSTPPILLQKKIIKNAKILDFLSLKEFLVDTFIETCALNSRKYVFQPSIDIPN